jgi:hypothetical protein
MYRNKHYNKLKGMIGGLMNEGLKPKIEILQENSPTLDILPVKNTENLTRPKPNIPKNKIPENKDPASRLRELAKKSKIIQIKDTSGGKTYSTGYDEVSYGGSSSNLKKILNAIPVKTLKLLLKL